MTELKFYDKNLLSFDIFNPDADGRISCDWYCIDVLNDMAAGDGPQNRQGRSATIKSVHINGVIEPYQIFLGDTTAWGLTVTRGGPVKLVVIWDKQPRGAYPDPHDIWDYSDPSLYWYTRKPINAMRNLSQNKRFVVLGSQTLNFKGPQGPAATDYNYKSGIVSKDFEWCQNPYFAGGGEVVLPFEFNIDLHGKGIQSIYDGTNGGSTHLYEGAISLWCCGYWQDITVTQPSSDGPVSVDVYPNPRIEAYSRVRFTSE